MNGINVPARDLRDKEKLKKIPHDRPGYYKWWANESELNDILDALGEKNTGIQWETRHAPDNPDKVQYCIYIGIAVRESVRSRLNWHVNQISTRSNIQHRTLSTLRQTVAALIGDSMADDRKTNDFIDKLTVEYFLSEYSIGSKSAIDHIKEIEDSYLQNSANLYILNIQGNKHKKSYAKDLIKRRKYARQEALNYFPQDR